MLYSLHVKSKGGAWKWAAQGGIDFILEVAQNRLERGFRVKLKVQKPKFHKN
jgi:hypothetical protein